MTTRKNPAIPTPPPELADTDEQPAVAPVDRNDCGFGPCPVQNCDWGNWGDLPVCRQHYVAHMDTVFLPEDDPDPDTTTSSDAVADTTTTED